MSRTRAFADADDNSVITVAFANGALVILDTGFVHRAGPNPMEIYGTEGYVGRDPHGGLLLTSTQLQPEGIQGYIKPKDLPNALPHPYEQWVDVILNDTPMTITVEDGRDLTEMLARSYQAARTGREVTF